MAAKVLCILTDGVEEIELVTPVDILRRAGAEVVMATPGARGEVVGKMGIRIGADALLSGMDPSAFDALLLPGGPAVAAL
ncbi:MAG: DJ-1/PfpI family protein, partial [Roseibacillus sp.]|nr:DJ-1/PfpI family protein [Roseibacillus sp.]